MLLHNRPRIRSSMGNNKILHAGLVSLLLASITFPLGSGQYLGAQLSMKELLETFFSNGSWSREEEFALGTNITHQLPAPTHDFSWPQGAHPALSSMETVSLFLLAKFFMVLLATSMVVPAGYFLPVFVYGAALGRLYGEVMAKIFPDGIVSEGIHLDITPAGYALAGAAAYSGAVTQTISTALLTFELTGQMSHILPVLLAVLVANAISQRAQPSFFEGIIFVKKLPFLPKLSVSKSRGHNFYAEEFMVADLKYLSQESKYEDLRRLLKASNLKQFPLVDSHESRILLGSIKRKHLSRLLSEHLSVEKRFQYMLSQLEKAQDVPGRKREESETFKGAAQHTPNAKVTWTKEEEEEEEEEKISESGPMSLSSPSPQKEPLLYHEMVEEWKCHRLQETLDLDHLPIDPAPYRLVGKETLYQCYDLFNLLSLRTAYVTNKGRLVGVVALKELKMAVEECVKGTLGTQSQPSPCKPETWRQRPSKEAEPMSPPA